MSADDRTEAPFLPLLACFFLSGAAGLAYELVWTRRLVLVFGSTTLAVSAVLAVYMGGLALGSVLGGRWADRPGCRHVRLYARLEVGVGLYALATPAVFAALDVAYVAACHAWDPGLAGSLALRLAGAAVALLAPTTLMGATLPVLARAVIADPRGLGTRLGLLYAANLFGAVVGVLGAVLWALPTVGLFAANLLAAAANGLAGAVAWRLQGTQARGPAGAETAASAPAAVAAPTAAGPTPTPARHRVLLALFAGAGFASFLYEVAWTKILALVFGSAVHAFGLILAAFLLGLGLGSLLSRRLLARVRDPWLLLGGVELVVGLSALLFLPLTGRYPDAYLWIFARAGGDYDGLLAGELALALAALLPATVGIGATFPVVARIYADAAPTLGRRLGGAYAVNTVGGIAGSLAAGFWLVPALGVYRATLVGGGINLAIALVALGLCAAPPRRRLALAAAATALAAVSFAVLPPWDPKLMTAGVHTYAELYLRRPDGLRRVKAERDLRYYREGLNGFITVESPRGKPQAVSLAVNGKADASNLTDMRTQMLLGHLPCLYHPRPETALVIGLGSGVTVNSIAQHPVRTVDVVEIEDAVREASAFFRAENGGVLADPRVRLFVDDGRNYVRTSGRRYDVIVSEPSNPWLSGPSHLFTREAFLALHAALAPGGVVSQWVQCYQIEEGLARTLVRTFASVFPHVVLFSDLRNAGDVVLLGSERPLVFDLDLFEARRALPGVGGELARMGLGTPGTLLGDLLLGEEDVARFVAGRRLNTDDLPCVEFESPRWLHGQDLGPRLYRALLGARAQAIPAGAVGRTLTDEAACHIVAVLARQRNEYGLTAEAAATVTEGLRRSPRDPELRLLAAMLRGDTQDALGLADLAEVVRRDPANAAAQSIYGRALRSAGRPQDALAAFRQAMAHGARTAEVLTLAGATLADLSCYDEAAGLLREAAGMEAGSVYALAQLAHVEEELGHLDAAVAALDRLLAREADPAKRRLLEAKREVLRGRGGR